MTARLKAPGWAVRFGGDAEGKVVPLVVAGDARSSRCGWSSKTPALLKTDERGGVFVHLNIEVPADGGRPDMKWQIESLAMEVEGRTADR